MFLNSQRLAGRRKEFGINFCNKCILPLFNISKMFLNKIEIYSTVRSKIMYANFFNKSC